MIIKTWIRKRRIKKAWEENFIKTVANQLPIMCKALCEMQRYLHTIKDMLKIQNKNVKKNDK